MGVFKIDFPSLGKTDNKTSYKIISKTATGSSATVQYEGGAALTAQVRPNGVITYDFTGVPDDVKEMKFSMLINISYSQEASGKSEMERTLLSGRKTGQSQTFPRSCHPISTDEFEGKSLSFNFPSLATSSCRIIVPGTGQLMI